MARKMSRRLEVLTQLRSAILGGDLPREFPIPFDTPGHPHHLAENDKAEVVATLIDEGLVVVRGNSVYMATLTEYELVELVELLWGMMRATLPHVPRKRVQEKVLLDSLDALRAKTTKLREVTHAVKYLLALAETVEALFTAVGDSRTGRLIRRELHRFHLLDPHAFNTLGVKDLDHDLSVLVSQLTSPELHANTIRDLVETLIQHLVQCWSADMVIARLAPRLMRHGVLRFEKPSRSGPHIHIVF